MERMTKRDKGGNARMDCDKCEIKYRENCCSTKLCRNALIDRLAAYEDAEEQGLLIRLPCKVGDTVFRIWNGQIEQYQVVSVWFNDHIKRRFHAECFPFYRFYDEDIGKRVFLTREEA